MLLDVRCDDAFDRRGVLKRLDLLVEPVEHDQRRRAGRDKRVVHLAFGVRRVERTRDRPDLPRPELRNEELRTVRKTNRDAVTPLDALSGEGSRECVAVALQLRIRDSGALEEQKWAIR